MTIIESMVPALEVYSIDEAFADLTGIPGDLTGIARTKTLANLANHTAKRLIYQTGGVVDQCDPFKCDWTVRTTLVDEVCGVGKRMKAHLEVMGIKRAMDLAKADAWTLRQKFSVVIEKTARELAGTSCLELGEGAPQSKRLLQPDVRQSPNRH